MSSHFCHRRLRMRTSRLCMRWRWPPPTWLSTHCAYTARRKFPMTTAYGLRQCDSGGRPTCFEKRRPAARQRYHVGVKLWVDSERIVQKAELFRSTGDPKSDVVIASALHGLTLSEGSARKYTSSNSLHDRNSLLLVRGPCHKKSNALPQSQRDFGYASFADSPTLRARWLVGIAVVVPILVATGVFWLHSLPGGAMRQVISDGMLEVNVVGSAQTVDTPQKQIVQLSHAPAKPPAVSVAASKVAAFGNRGPAGRDVCCFRGSTAGRWRHGRDTDAQT